VFGGYYCYFELISIHFKLTVICIVLIWILFIVCSPTWSLVSLTLTHLISNIHPFNSRSYFVLYYELGVKGECVLMIPYLVLSVDL